jgi:hypothetical protein
MGFVLGEYRLFAKHPTLSGEYDYSSHFKKVCKIPIIRCPNHRFFKSIEKQTIRATNPGSYLTLFKNLSLVFDNANCLQVSINSSRVSVSMLFKKLFRKVLLRVIRVE